MPAPHGREEKKRRCPGENIRIPGQLLGGDICPRTAAQLVTV